MTEESSWHNLNASFNKERKSSSTRNLDGTNPSMNPLHSCQPSPSLPLLSNPSSLYKEPAHLFPVIPQESCYIANNFPYALSLLTESNPTLALRVTRQARLLVKIQLF